MEALIGVIFENPLQNLGVKSTSDWWATRTLLGNLPDNTEYPRAC